MDAYDEPFDELIGVSHASRKETLKSQVVPLSPAIVSPEPSPVSMTRGTTGPPSSAFSSHSSGPPPDAFSATSDRWAQYEKDGARLRHESEIATGRAVYSAAERAAYRDTEDLQNKSFKSPYTSSSVSDRMSSAGASLPHPDEVRSGGRTPGGFSFSSSRRSQRPAENESAHDTHDRVRAEALKVLEMADDFTSPIRKTRTGGFTTDPESVKRVPARMSGLSFASNRSSQSSRVSEASTSDARYTIDDGDSDDDMVDVVQMQTTVGRSSVADDSSNKSSWSSRYSVSQSLMDLTTGGYTDTKVILDKMDYKEQQRMEKSARNMFRTSPHQSTQSPKIFGNGFSFSAKNVFGKKEQPDPKSVNLKTVWMDVDLQSNGRSLTLPPLVRKHRGPVSLEQARKRRRICIGVIVSIILVVIIASVAGTQAPKSSAPQALTDPNAVKFYVTADVPYDSGQEDKIIRDLETIPGEADFVIHLGNIQDASVTLCPQQAYISARAILRTSTSPVFVLPGPNDWTNCPRPDLALKDWNANLGYFERNFVHSFSVTHQLGNEENFSFLTKGVFFIGLHLINGRKQNKEEWRVRHAKNVRWVTEQVAQVPQDQFRALVFLANARPSQQHDDFFSEIFDEINALRKPVLYIHANAGSDIFEQYSPFKNAPNLVAVQVQSGGSTPPLRVAVGNGGSPFAFD